jgi:hypothetical protein
MKTFVSAIEYTVMGAILFAIIRYTPQLVEISLWFWGLFILFSGFWVAVMVEIIRNQVVEDTDQIRFSFTVNQDGEPEAEETDDE